MLDELRALGTVVDCLNDEGPLHSSIDDIVAIYKKDVDRSLLRENLKLSVDERFERFERLARQFNEIHESGRRHRGEA